MVNYWAGRRRQALHSGREAHSAELRELYERIAGHCRSLEQWCSASRASGDPFLMPAMPSVGAGRD